jgi:DNA-directed RNA polymerase specialized sigma24 family protein
VPSLSITSTPPADEEPNEADKLLLASLPPAQRAVISLAEIKAIITREGGGFNEILVTIDYIAD